MMDEKIYYDSDTESQKRLLWWLYLMYGLSMIFFGGVLSFIPLIINYLKRADTEGSFLRSHHSWQIRSFCWYLVWVFLALVCFMTIIGIPVIFLIYLGSSIWLAYRLIRGFLNLNANKAMPM
jgi:uncharacterized membrane protein